MVTPAPTPQPAPHPMKVRHFRNLWMGAAVSVFGDQFYLVALPWLVLQMTGSTLALGAILMTAGVPREAFMLMGGAVSDRFPLRNVMLTTAWSRTFLVGAVAVLAYAHLLRMPHLYALAFAFGIADAFTFPAFQALMPRLLEPSQLTAGNALMQGMVQFMTMAGPVPAGFVIKRWGVSAALGFDAISFLFIIAAYWSLPSFRLETPKTHKNVFHDIVEGLRYVLHDAQLRGMTILFAVLNLCFAGPIMVGLAALGRFRFGSATAFGTTLACFSGGSLAGMAIAGMRRTMRRRGVFLLCVYTLISAGMAAIGFVYSLWAVGAILAVMGVAAGLLNIQLMAWFQTKADRSMMGRLMSVLMFAAFGLMPLSYAVAGAIARWSLSGLFIVGGIGSLLVVILTAMNKAVREID